MWMELHRVVGDWIYYKWGYDGHIPGKIVKIAVNTDGTYSYKLSYWYSEGFLRGMWIEESQITGVPLDKP